MRFAYADPPYLGQAQRHYSADPRCAEVDHAELIGRLVREFPDGWALSASSPSLGEILPLCPPGYRIAVWCKSFCAFKRNVRPAYAWEPVIFWGGRNPMNGHRAVIPERNGQQTTPKDFIVEPITMRKGLTGAKPAKVCRWILDLLNAKAGDEIVDLYPGTGVMGRVAARLTEEETADLFPDEPLFQRISELEADVAFARQLMIQSDKDHEAEQASLFLLREQVTKALALESHSK